MFSPVHRIPLGEQGCARYQRPIPSICSQRLRNYRCERKPQSRIVGREANRMRIIVSTFLLLLFSPMVGCNGEPESSAVDALIRFNDGSITTDAANLTPTDAAPGIPSSDGAVGVSCGAELCTGSQICCAGLAGASCTEPGACTGFPASCDGPEDCTTAGEVCCGSQTGSSCQPQASCQTVVCRTPSDCPNQGDSCCDLFVAKACFAQCPF